jgi:hypothetical protein
MERAFMLWYHCHLTIETLISTEVNKFCSAIPALHLLLAAALQQLK